MFSLGTPGNRHTHTPAPSAELLIFHYLYSALPSLDLLLFCYLDLAMPTLDLTYSEEQWILYRTEPRLWFFILTEGCFILTKPCNVWVILQTQHCHRPTENTNSSLGVSCPYLPLNTRCGRTALKLSTRELLTQAAKPRNELYLALPNIDYPEWALPLIFYYADLALPCYFASRNYPCACALPLGTSE